MLNIAKLEQLIKEKGWSKTFFAAMFGKNKGWITDMKRGIGLPDNNLLQAIADQLNTTVDYLTDKTDVKEQKNKPITSKEDDELINLFEQLPKDKRQEAVNYLRYLIEHREK